MKPAVWRIFRNGRWSYSDTPSSRSEDRAAWQPLYAEQATIESEREACAKVLDRMAENDKLSNYFKVAALAIRERGAP
jgi:hypothetical protein